MERRDYGEALNRLASLKPVVDEFFDNVMVLVEDPEVKRNRLSLLNALSLMFQDIADISLLK